MFGSAEALRLQREELEAKVAHSDARLAERKAAQLREIEERRLAAALAEEERLANVEEQKRAKEYASSALASNAEIKEQRIEEAARRKVVGDVMRAEASRLRFKKKRLRADRRVQVRDPICPVFIPLQSRLQSLPAGARAPVDCGSAVVVRPQEIEFERLLAKERSDAKMGKTGALITAKKDLNEGRRAQKT